MVQSVGWRVRYRWGRDIWRFRGAIRRLRDKLVILVGYVLE